MNIVASSNWDHTVIFIDHACPFLDPDKLVPFILTLLVQQRLWNPREEIDSIDSFLYPRFELNQPAIWFGRQTTHPLYERNEPRDIVLCFGGRMDIHLRLAVQQPILLLVFVEQETIL